jgi:DNA-binding MarR family transcriptional regulator
LFFEMLQGVRMTKRSKAAERISTAFQRLIPRIILLHEQVAKDAGISGVALQVLHAVALNPGPISPSELSEQTGLPRSTVSRVLAQLEARGHLVRSSVPGDLRRALIAQNPGTVREVRDRFGIYAQALDRVGRRFSADELTIVARYWQELLNAVEAGFPATEPTPDPTAEATAEPG